MLLNRDRANEIMDREGLDALVAVEANNVFYLSNYQSDFLYDPPWLACAILPRSPDIEPCLIITEIDVCVLTEEPSWMPDIRPYYFELFDNKFAIHTFNTDEPLTGQDAEIRAYVAGMEKNPTLGMVNGAAQALKDKGLHKMRLGFDDIRFAGVLGDLLDDGKAVDAGNLFMQIRMVKTPDEIALLRQAAQRNQKALSGAIEAVHVGATWQEVYTAYEVGVVQQQARPFATFNGAGPKSAGAARPNRDYQINDGDMVCFDCMLKYKRYMGDVQRTVAVGQVPDKLERYWQAMKIGIDEGYSSLRPGATTGELRQLVVDTVRKAGIPDFEVAFIHGIGLDHLEVPVFGSGRLGLFTLEKDMVINMDLEIHEIGFGGVFFEETMLITENGAERLYSLPRDMIRV
jgi:Xaa-Pro dipeptidase